MPDVVVVTDDPPEDAPANTDPIVVAPEPTDFPSEQLAAQELIDRHDEEVAAEEQHQEKHRYTAEKLSEHDLLLTTLNDRMAACEQGLEEWKNSVSTIEEPEIVITDTEPEPAEDEEPAPKSKPKMGLFGHRKS